MSMKRFNEKELEAVKQIIENGEYLSGFTTSFRGGENVQKFEKNFARFIGMKYAISVNSGTAALFISFKAIIHGYDHLWNTLVIICFLQLYFLHDNFPCLDIDLFFC